MAAPSECPTVVTDVALYLVNAVLTAASTAGADLSEGNERVKE